MAEYSFFEGLDLSTVPRWGSIAELNARSFQAFLEQNMGDGSVSPEEATASCPGRELEPNLCSCPCYGCKHHCSAHDPTDVTDS